MTDLKMPKDWSQVEVGEAFGEQIIGQYLHCKLFGGWLRWDGRRWARDSTDAVYEDFRLYIHALEDDLFKTMERTRQTEEFKKQEKNAQDRIIEGLMDKIRACRNYYAVSNLHAAIKTASRLEALSVLPAIFDNHPDLLNVGNGVVDLKTGIKRPHDPKLYLTTVTNVDYVPGAKHEDLETAKGATSASVWNWLHVLYGYCATGRVSEDVMPVFDGSGANGKTTILLAVAEALGDYSGKASASLLMRGAHEQHPAIFADLKGKRMVYIEETAEAGRLAVETMKDLTGGGAIKGRFMRQDWFEFPATHKIIVATNYRPVVNSTDYATWRRLMLVPFPYRYTSEDDPARRVGDLIKDKSLRDRLRYGKKQQEAVLAMIVEGAKRWYSRGLQFCDDITEASQQWRAEEDVIYRFLNEMEAEGEIGFHPEVQMSSSLLFQIYSEWCETQGRTVGSLKTFSKRLEEHDETLRRGIRKGRTKTGVKWFGVGIPNQLTGQMDVRSQRGGI